MRTEQISVFLENRAGRLAEVTRVLAEAGVNIRALSLADSSDFGILRLIVDKNDVAEVALKEQGFTVHKTHVVAVEVEDRPGGLHTILQTLNEAGVNVAYMYAFVQHSGEKAVIILRLDQPDTGLQVLNRKGFRVIEGSTLATL